LTPLRRRQLRRIHLILAAPFALVLIVVAVSGAILVWQRELESALGPKVAWDGATLAEFGVVRDRAAALRPDHRLQMLWFPAPGQPYFTAAYAIAEREYTDRLYLHPATTEVLAESPSAFVPWIEELHESLHLGAVGAWLVKWSTPVLVLLIASGCALSWPVGCTFSSIWRVRRGRPFLHDSHRIIGLVALPFLLVMAFTGAVWVFPGALERAVYAVAGEEMPATSVGSHWQLASVEPAPGAEDADVPTMLSFALADSDFPARVDYVSFPIHTRENRQIRLRLDTAAGEARSVYYFDRYSGELLAKTTPGAGGAEWYLHVGNAALHVGSIGGTPTRLLWCLACLGLVYLAASGAWLWARRKLRH